MSIFGHFLMIDITVKIGYSFLIINKNNKRNLIT